MSRKFIISAVIVCSILSIAAFLQASGIVPAIVPALAPATSRRGDTTPAGGAGIFQLAANTTAGAAGAPICDDGTGKVSSTPCPPGGVSNTTPVTVSTATTADQQLMELSLSAGFLNTAGKSFDIFGAGFYTLPGTQSALTHKIKLCTVSGCGSGTVVTLMSTTAATSAANVTNANWSIQAVAVTAATGATGNLETHGRTLIELTAPPNAVTGYQDANTAVSANIDLTAALFLDFTVAFNTSSASNTCIQRSGAIAPQANAGGGGSGGGSVGPGAEAYNSATQTISGITNTALTFNTNVWDTCSACTIHSTSVNPTRFTAPSAGYYLAICSTLATTGASFNLFFEVNGSVPTPQAGNNATVQTGQNTFGVYSQMYHLNTNDFVECFTSSNGGYTTTANQSLMSLTKLSGTL